MTTHTPKPQSQLEELQTVAKNQVQTETAVRTKTAMLREIFDCIENALHAGYSRHTVLQILNSEGYGIKADTFFKSIYRIRHGVKNGPLNRPSTQSPTTESRPKPQNHGGKTLGRKSSTRQFSFDELDEYKEIGKRLRRKT